jgi:hypothetical protein
MEAVLEYWKLVLEYWKLVLEYWLEGSSCLHSCYDCCASQG